MTLMNTSTRYGAVSQSFHWLTVVLVGAAYLLSVEGPESRIYAPENASALSLHETLGILVIVVVVLRLAWRLVDRPPEDPPMAAWMLYSSLLVHWALYLLLAAIPLAGILGALYGGHPVTLLGFGPVGPFLTTSSDLGRSLAEVHGTLGNLIIIVAGLHAAAALFHHFVLRDRVLLSMLPGSRPLP
jgi:cytochrome b561